jgi:hypothetical protein
VKGTGRGLGTTAKDSACTKKESPRRAVIIVHIMSVCMA